MRVVKSILLFLLIVTIIVFTAQNMEIVRVSFLNWHLEMPLSITIVLIYLFGAVSGGIMFTIIKNLSTKDKNTDE